MMEKCPELDDIEVIKESVKLINFYSFLKKAFEQITCN